MMDRDHDRQDGDDTVRIGRRGFIGAGFVGAGAALIAPGTAAAARSARATVQEGSARPGLPSGASGAGTSIARLPLQSEFPHLPSIPLDPAGALDTLGKLSVRASQATQAKQSLTQRFWIHGVTRTGYGFLFAGPATTADAAAKDAFATMLREHPEAALPDAYTRHLRRQGGVRREVSPRTGSKPLSLERPEQFSISWPTLAGVRGEGLSSLPKWASSLTDAESASRQFWPTIAHHGLSFNLILPERVTRARSRELRRIFHTVWDRELRASAPKDLYVIDMSRFEALQPNVVHGAPRFTPSTITLLTRNPRTKALTPAAIMVSGYRGRGRTVFSRASCTDGAWLYALQAAKASITVFGIWLGHVYQWHLVTAAMQMTMLNTLPTGHPVRRLLGPHSKYVIPFDDVLLALWPQIAPPTSLASATEFLRLANDYAAGRSYFDDDPRTTLSRLGLRQADFTRTAPWDQYPVVQRLLAVWDLVATYVSSYVRAAYRSDASVAADRELQAWIATASARTGGNIRGLPQVNSRAALGRVLTSLLYRVTVHGVARLLSTSNPALTFVANFPHCLQSTHIPRPHARLSTQTLLTYLPAVTTIGQAVSFYFTFAFSTPYEPMIPLGGINSELLFARGPRDRRNRALVEFRSGLVAFMNQYQPGAPQTFQWPRNIET